MRQRRFAFLFALAVLALPALAAGTAFARAPDANVASPAKVEARRLEALAIEIDRPTPSNVCSGAKGGPNSCDYGQVYHALALFYLQRNSAETSAANQEIAEALPLMQAGIGAVVDDEERDFAGPEKARPFHFMRAGMLYRLVALFGAEGTKAKGLLSQDNEIGIRALMGAWAAGHCRVEDADPQNTWRIWRSENHSIQLMTACWQAADIARQQGAPVAYDDKSTAEQQYVAWTSFLTAFIRERALHGFIEYYSPTYTGYTLAAVYDLADFSTDAKLKSSAQAYLQLWWALWAQEQISGVHGGSSNRVYDDTIADGSAMKAAAWIYFGFGEPARNTSNSANLLTSQFVPDPVVASLATGAQQAEPYTIVERVPGRSLPREKGSTWASVDPKLPGIVRTTYRGEGFVMGSAAMPVLNFREWYSGSAQNRMNMLLLNDGSARVAVASYPEDRKSSYNAIDSVQSHGAMIAVRLGQGVASGGGPLGVYLSPSLAPIEEDGWVFVDASAFVAIRPLGTSYEWRGKGKTWLIPTGGEVSAVLIEASPKSRFADFAAFKAAVKGTPPEIAQTGISYTPLDGGAISYSTDPSMPPTVDGTPIDFGNRAGVTSPFVSIDEATASATVTFEGATLNLGF